MRADMAKLRLSHEYLVECIFHGLHHDVEVNGIEYNKNTGIITIDINSPNVPDCEEVVAIVTKQDLSIKFHNIDEG
jgi:hypothetical protein